MSDRHAPPGTTGEVHAERVLVISPHFDDEVIGCGGLLARLAHSGAVVRVLYLTDSSGGKEYTGDRAAYAARRRGETVAGLAALGVHDARFLDLEDGALEQHLEEAAAGIARELEDLAPDLLLSVSPLEVTSDHQAAFAALHRVLATVRPGDALEPTVSNLRLLLYEVNGPIHPDLLVDVGAELDAVRSALGAHESQLELHNYLEASLGARRYRTFSLPPQVTAAEGYRTLCPSDLTTRSVAGLIRALGGEPTVFEVREGPTISVVVRTKDRPGLLAQALASLAAGSYRRAEVVLVNDGGTPPEVAPDFPLPLVQLDLPSNRGRAGAANAGIEAASGQYVAFLDDDDLAEPEHLATLAGLVQAADVEVAYTDAAAGIYELDPDGGWREVERRLPYSRDFDPDLLLFDNYIPFNTLLIHRELLLEAGPLDPGLEFFEDWDLLIRLSRLAPFHHLGRVTCEYRHFRSGGRQILGERPSERADFEGMKARIIERHRDHHTPEVLARVVSRLRGETVQRAEELRTRTEEMGRLRDVHLGLADAHRRLDGEWRARTGELEAALAAQQRRAGELEDRLGEQSELTARLYAEIERLNGLVATMEATKAWRLHRTLERLRGRRPSS